MDIILQWIFLQFLKLQFIVVTKNYFCVKTTANKRSFNSYKTKKYK